jgi:proline dehydrogenase
MLSRALIALSESERAERLVRRDFVSRAVVRRFVAGDEIDDALRIASSLERAGIGAILDLLGEGVRDRDGAELATREYADALQRLGGRARGTTISVKLSQLGLHVDQALCERNLTELCERAAAVGSAVEVDMEASADVDPSLEVYRRVHATHPDVRIALQAYLRRTPSDLEMLRPLKPRVRLVKGAYAEPQDVALQHRDEIDEQFVFLAAWLGRHGSAPAFGTHDERLLQRILPLFGDIGRADYEVQMLYGVRPDLQSQLAASGTNLRVYIPYGTAWYPYLTRRLAERPSNLRFFLRAAVSPARAAG